MLASIWKLFGAIKLAFQIWTLLEKEYEKHEIDEAYAESHSSIMEAFKTKDTTRFQNFLRGIDRVPDPSEVPKPAQP